MEAMSECPSGETVMSGLKPHGPCTAQRCFLLLSRRASLCGHAVTQSQSRCVPDGEEQEAHCCFCVDRASMLLPCARTAYCRDGCQVQWWTQVLPRWSQHCYKIFPQSWSRSGGGLWRRRGVQASQAPHAWVDLSLRELSRMVLFHMWIIFQLQLHFALSYKSYKHRP